ncbi:hypothetical protein N023_25040 [Pseudomonas syringae CC440]|nr:hypothetical protein [Pseudomonas syringae]UOF19828.1 hypothetical protein N023_25040 [Pseudomonas syringae CC440]
MERDDLHREIYRAQGKLTSCFGYDSMGRKAWQYATTLPAEKLSQIQNPLIKPERYVEHAYNPIHRRYEYDPAGLAQCRRLNLIFSGWYASASLPYSCGQYI